MNFKSLKLKATPDFQTLDSLRFVAAYSIVIYHFQQELQVFGLAHFFNFFTKNFHLFVDLFFIISGFIISFVYFEKINSFHFYFDFIKKRLARLWPLHILILASYVSIWALATSFNIAIKNPEKYDFNCLMPHFLLLHSLNTCKGIAFNYVSWSISAEFVVYVFTPIFFIIAQKTKHGALLMSLAVTSILFVSTNGNYFNWTTSWGALRAIPAFMFGIYLYQIRYNLTWIPKPQFLCWTALLLFFCTGFFDNPNLKPLVVSLIYGIVIFAVASDSRELPPKIVRLLSPLGQLTYGAYMLHPILQTILFSFFAQKIFKLTGMASDIYLGLLTLIVLPISLLSLHLIETPLRKRISSLEINPFTKPGRS